MSAWISYGLLVVAIFLNMDFSGYLFIAAGLFVIAAEIAAYRKD